MHINNWLCKVLGFPLSIILVMKSRKKLLKVSLWSYSTSILLFILINTNTVFALGQPSSLNGSSSAGLSHQQNYTRTTNEGNHLRHAIKMASQKHKDTMLSTSRNQENKAPGNKIRGTVQFFIATEADKSLPIESWMINNRYFKSCWTTDPEKDLKIENWMIDQHLWGR